MRLAVNRKGKDGWVVQPYTHELRYGRVFAWHYSPPIAGPFATKREALAEAKRLRQAEPSPAVHPERTTEKK